MKRRPYITVDLKSSKIQYLISYSFSVQYYAKKKLTIKQLNHEWRTEWVSARQTGSGVKRLDLNRFIEEVRF